MDKLGMYLLVSLFFVVASMIEFAIALLVKRNSREQTVELEKNKNKILTQNMSLKRSLSQMRIGFPPTTDSFSKSRTGLRMNKSSECLELYGKRRNAKFFTSSYNILDIAASILFPIFYALFNIVYWWLVFDNLTVH